ncbi:MAG TPA: hypothetical protein ENN20_01160 [Candidatus Marinimicrobia bacterium]|nr:hypothetical protein [Candidatus Neomarinimicrobiota bacterium]
MQKVLPILLLALFQFACSSMPRLIWRENDVLPVRPESAATILIASRQSAFKAAVIETVAVNYQTTNIAVKIVGLEALESENPADYQAVVLINTCMAWKMDPAVEFFLKQYPAAGNIIILTTSGDGDWLPKNRNGQYDAISAASEMADVEKTAAKIIQKIDVKIK